MTIAQQLYEGVDIAGEGTVGLITYMRTDSLRLSDEAMAAARDFIRGALRARSIYPGQPTSLQGQGRAPRTPTRPSGPPMWTWTPESIKKDLTAEQYRLYKLIWSRFLACQMANAVYDSVTIEVTRRRAMSSGPATPSLKFAGFTAVYEEGKDEEERGRSSPRCPTCRREKPLA